MKVLKSTVGKALAALLVFTVLCGVLYPAAVFGVSQLGFSEKANGSILEVNGKKYGSALLAQQFTGNQYLWGRVMLLNTGTFQKDNGTPLLYAGPSNLSPASEEYQNAVRERVEKLKAAHPEQAGRAVPVDLATVSGSGLDPHISPTAADYQIERIARARGIPTQRVEQAVKACTTGRFLGIFGEPVVNVLKVNLMLDGILK